VKITNSKEEEPPRCGENTNLSWLENITITSQEEREFYLQAKNIFYSNMGKNYDGYEVGDEYKLDFLRCSSALLKCMSSYSATHSLDNDSLLAVKDFQGIYRLYFFLRYPERVKKINGNAKNF